MRCSRLVLQSAVGFCLVFFSFSTYAQIPPSSSTTSTPVPGAGHDYLGGLSETVNPANGSVSFRLPVIVPPGRGLTFPFAFAYDSNGVNYLSPSLAGNEIWSTTQSVISQGGWSNTAPVVSVTQLDWTSLDFNNHPHSCHAWVNYVYQDANGNRHNLNLSNYYDAGNGTGPCTYDSNSWPYGFNSDLAGSGGEGPIAASITANYHNGGGPVTVTDGDGTVFNFPYSFGTTSVIPTSATDRNGNIISIGGTLPAFNYVDTTGRTVLQDSGFAVSPETVSVSGLGAPYSLTWTTLSTPTFTTPVTPLQGTCSSPGFNTTSWTSIHAVSSIQLPNGKSFTFTYDRTHGLVNQINYPTGGYVRYVWGMNIQAEFGRSTPPDKSLCTMLYAVPAITDRYVSNGTMEVQHQHFVYLNSWQTNPVRPTTKQTTVTTTDLVRNTSFVTVYNYADLPADTPPNTAFGPSSYDPVEASIAYQDTTGLLLKTVSKTWSNPRLLKSQETAFPNGQATETTLNYDANEMQIEQDDYDFGTTAPPNPPGPLLRKTVIGYATFGTNHIVDKPVSVKTYDSTGTTLAAETDYGYDTPAATATSGIVQHSGGCKCGNLTSSSSWLNSSGSTLTSTFTNDDTGQRLSATDPRGNTTSYSYTDTYSSGTPPGPTNTYITTVTHPVTGGVNHIEKYAYAYASGEMTSFTDQNNLVTTYKYGDNLARMTETDFPDGGTTTIAYNDAAYNPSTPTPSVTTTKKINGATSQITVSSMDGLGHVVKTTLATDPDCPTGDIIATSYDGLGRVYTESNPYCTTGDSTYGLTTYLYDSLGRTKQVTHPDNAYISTSYAGRATEVIDEGNGTTSVARVSQVDGLGRLVSVCEVSSTTQLGAGGAPGACPQDIAKTGFLTSYSYDPLNNLKTVNQGSLAQRTFAYDSLSRLLCAANPETGGSVACPNPDNGTYTPGTTRYGYDANGNLAQRTRPAPNQHNASSTVKTTYSYDPLNRLTQTSYDDGVTLPALFGYDQTNITMGSQQFTIANSIGRLSWTCRQTPAGNCHPMTATSYDPMGRVAELWQEKVIGTNNIWVSYLYDLMGDETDRNVSGADYTSAYNAAGRLTTFTATGWTNLLANGHYDAFGHIISANFANGLSESWAYDKRERLTAAAVGTSCSAGACTGSTAYGYTVSYTPNSNVLSSTDTVNGNWTYTYDDLNRLSTGGANNGEGCSWEYDRYGNRWHQNAHSGSCPAPQYSFTGNNNHIDQYSANYDAAGNLLNDGTNSYTYAPENRIISVSNGPTTYIYDAEGQRVGRAGNAGMDMIYDREGHVILYNATVSPDSPMVQLYVDGMHLGGYVVNSAVTNADFYYDHADWLGTERAHSNMAGTLCEATASLPFGDGQVIRAINGGCADSNDVSPNHFTGKERDTESNLDMFGARYYGSSPGRFMTPDDGSDQHPSDPESWNLYSYVRNNPLSDTDPTGRCAYSNGKYTPDDVSDCSEVEDKTQPPTITVTAKPPSTFETWADNTKWFANYASEQTAGNWLGSLMTANSTKDPLTFGVALIGLINIFGEGGEAENTIKAVVESAEGAHNAQISVAERALAKKLGHAAAEGSTSAFQGVQKGTSAAVVRDIMSNPARVVRGAVTTDVYNAAGQGVRFENGTGRFVGFLEASRATR